MSVYFKSAIVGLLSMLSLSTASAQTLQGYWTVDEFVTMHPDQKYLMDGLSKRVRETPQPWTGKLESPIKIAAVYPAQQSSDYWRRSLTSFERRMEDIAIPFETQLFSSGPKDPLEVQKQQLTEALAWDPDYLVFTLDVLRHQKMIERVLLRGKPKLILQNITTPLRDWDGRQPFLYVGFDHALGTQKLAEEYIRRTDGKGEYLMLYFTRGFVSTMRGGTFQKHVAEHSDLTMVGSYFTDGDQDKARKSVLDAITRNPTLRNFYACSTDVALGALSALDELGLTNEALVNGWGGGGAELTALKQGRLDFTIMRMNDDNGVAMAEAIRLDMGGQGHQVPTIYSGDMELITDRTSAQHIDDLIAHAFRYSGIPK